MYDYYDYMYHHGIKGMRWGIRRFQPYPKGKFGKFLGRTPESDAERDRLKKEKLLRKRNRKIKRLSKKAAKTYYKKDLTDSFKNYRKYDRELEKREAHLTNHQITKGRYLKARNNLIRSASLATASSVLTNGFLIGAGASAINPLLSLGVGTAVAMATHGNYYRKQRKIYKERKDI